MKNAKLQFKIYRAEGRALRWGVPAADGFGHKE